MSHAHTSAVVRKSLPYGQEPSPGKLSVPVPGQTLSPARKGARLWVCAIAPKANPKARAKHHTSYRVYSLQGETLHIGRVQPGRGEALVEHNATGDAITQGRYTWTPIG